MQLMLQDLKELSLINLLWFPSKQELNQFGPTRILQYRVLAENAFQASCIPACHAIIAFGQPLLYIDETERKYNPMPERRNYTSSRLYELSQIITLPIPDHLLKYSLPDPLGYCLERTLLCLLCCE